MNRLAKVAIGTATAVALVGAGVAVGDRVKSPQQAAADALPPPQSLVTAQAELRALVDVFVTRGHPTVGGGVALTAPSSLAGPAAVVTGVRAKVGSQLGDGQVVIEVSGEPLIVATLPFRLYRDIRIGDKGPDVLAFSTFLRRSGHLGAASETATESMRQAVARLLANRGYGQAFGESPEDANLVVRQRWILRTDKSGRKVSRVGVTVGSDIKGEDAVLLECDWTPPTVEARVDQAAARRIKVGSAANVTDDSNNRTIRATIGSVDASPTTDSASGISGYLVVVLPEPSATLTGLPQDVRVTIESPVDTGPVLAVPTTAVYTDESGHSHVILARDGARGTDVDVQLGPCVAGWCQILSSAVPLSPETTLVIGFRSEGDHG